MSRMLKLDSLSSSLVGFQNPNTSISTKSPVSNTTSFGFAPNFIFSGKRLSLTCRQYEYLEPDRPAAPSPPKTHASSAPQNATAGPTKVYVGHSVYKGKAALTIGPAAPEFTALDSGAVKLTREGTVLLQFAPAAGVRMYDWSRKQVISLSASEIGSLVSLGPKESCEFYHDPFKGKSEEGQVKKVLKVEPLPDGTGHFFNLSVQNKLINVDENIYVPVTKAEFAVFKSAFNYILPYLLGWHAFANSVKPEDTTRVSNATPKYGGDYEWSR